MQAWKLVPFQPRAPDQHSSLTRVKECFSAFPLSLDSLIRLFTSHWIFRPSLSTSQWFMNQLVFLGFNTVVGKRAHA